MKTGATTIRTHSRDTRGFSLVELLAVIAIIVLLLAIAVPATGALLRSNERSLAENQLRVGIAAGRDAAIRSESGDGAAVFFYNESNRLVIVPCVAVATISDAVMGSDGMPIVPSVANPEVRVRREVFVPVAAARAIQLPRGWSVRGYADPGMIHQDMDGKRNGWYDLASTMPPLSAADGNWVFPETAMYDKPTLSGDDDSIPDASAQGFKRHTFMIRFDKQTGLVNTSNLDPVVVVDLSPSDRFRTDPATPFGKRWSNLSRAQNLAEMVKQIAARSAYARQPAGSGVSETQRLLGDRSADTVLTRPVSEIALYEEERMALALGAKGVNRRTQTIYGDANALADFAEPVTPLLDNSLFPAGTMPEVIQQRINGWIAADPTAAGNSLRGSIFTARVFTVQRALGQLQEIQP